MSTFLHQPAASIPLQPRSVLIVSADGELRHRIADRLVSMRWKPLLAKGGAEAFAHLDAGCPEAVVLDGWLPDLDAGEFSRDLASIYPDLDVLGVDGIPADKACKGPRRHELLHALRQAQEGAPTDGAAWLTAPATVPSSDSPGLVGRLRREVAEESAAPVPCATAEPRQNLPDLVGDSVGMRELAEDVRLAAPFDVSILIEGETGTGKEVVARAVHRLSGRANKPFVVLNCAAIPEQLLEAELFGHTRGAFTGAVTSRVGRIEAAHGGTLFLDEIGEMPVALQAKMLRFLECGELQKIGDNESLRVDVRIVAATHQPLEQRAEEGTFRLDLYHRLAVFPVHLPALRDRMDDLPMLVAHLLGRLGVKMPQKQISPAALQILSEHTWPGNVRELGHVLERAVILAGDRRELLAADIRIRRRVRGSTADSAR